MTEIQGGYRPESRSQYEFEKHPVVSFEEYRRICDEATNDFRKIGIQEKEAFENAMIDKRTVFTSYKGDIVPFASPIGYEKMYDEQKCEELTNRSNIYLLSLPYSIVCEIGSTGDVELGQMGDDVAIIVEEFTDMSDGSEVPHKTFSGNKFIPFDFAHPDLAGVPGHETAWMAGYSLRFQPREESPKPYNGEDLTQLIEEVWSEECQKQEKSPIPGVDAKGTYILTPRQLAQNPEIADGLWAISEVGFGKVLGANHPVAMEFNREFFDQQISAADSVVAVHYEDGEPVCFGFLGFGMNNNDWLNTESDVITNELDDAQNDKRAYVHFYELISDGLKGMGYSTNILKTFFSAAADMGFEYDVFFESTNLSATYIPPIIEKEIDSSKDVESTKRVKLLGKLNYWALLSEPT